MKTTQNQQIVLFAILIFLILIISDEIFPHQKRFTKWQLEHMSAEEELSIQAQFFSSLVPESFTKTSSFDENLDPTTYRSDLNEFFEPINPKISTQNWISWHQQNNYAKFNKFGSKNYKEKFYHFKQRKILPNFPENPHRAHQKKPKAIIIVAEFRTGSTFFSEIFNSHPEIMYIYEPLSILKEHCTEDENIHSQKIDMLKDYLHDCNLPWMDKYFTLESIKKLPGNTQATFRNCLKAGICYRGKSRRFINRPYCDPRLIRSSQEEMSELYRNKTGLDPGNRFTRKRRQASNENDSSEEDPSAGVNACPPIDKNLAENECKHGVIPATKVIRLCHLRDLDQLLSSPEKQAENTPADILGFDGLEILYLVRDPRGIANSRIKVKGLDSKAQASITTNLDLCSRFSQNLQFIQENNYKNVHTVRYEDLVLNPFEESKRILKYLNLLPYPRTLSQFFNLNMGFKKNNGGYGTSRDDPVAAAFGWREMDFNLIKNVQTVCHSTIELMGYNLMTSEDNAKNLSFYSLDPEWKGIYAT